MRYNSVFVCEFSDYGHSKFVKAAMNMYVMCWNMYIMLFYGKCNVQAGMFMYLFAINVHNTMLQIEHVSMGHDTITGLIAVLESSIRPL